MKRFSLILTTSKLPDSFVLDHYVNASHFVTLVRYYFTDPRKAAVDGVTLLVLEPLMKLPALLVRENLDA